MVMKSALISMGHRLSVFAILCVGLAGCAAQHQAMRDDVEADADVGPEIVTSDRDQTSSADDEAVPGCSSTGTLDFRVTGSGIQKWNGRHVYAMAVEPDSLNTLGETSERRVAVHGTISDGSFLLECIDSLHENGAYPSYALFVDVDEDGGCSLGDVGFEFQLYSWVDDVGIELPPEAWRDVASLDGSFYSPSVDFCASYFGTTP